ncbi:MAG: hypothetical protein ACEQSL_06255 [Sediminibacterium sp.]
MFELSIRKKTPLELWKLHREEFLKIYNAEQTKPLTHSALVKAFLDNNGKQIYRFSKDIALPIERFGKMKEYLTWMAAGLSGDELTMLTNSMEKILEDGIGKNQKNVSALGAIIQEMKKRKQLVIHTELLYNFIAVQLVREDEAPEHFDNDIHLDKIKSFKEMAEKEGAYFFFQKEELKRLSHLHSLSAEEWEIYWEESLIKQELLPKALKVFESVTM